MFCLGEGAEGWVESEEDILRRGNFKAAAYSVEAEVMDGR